MTWALQLRLKNYPRIYDTLDFIHLLLSFIWQTPSLVLKTFVLQDHAERVFVYLFAIDSLVRSIVEFHLNYSCSIDQINQSKKILVFMINQFIYFYQVIEFKFLVFEQSNLLHILSKCYLVPSDRTPRKKLYSRFCMHDPNSSLFIYIWNLLKPNSIYLPT